MLYNPRHDYYYHYNVNFVQSCAFELEPFEDLKTGPQSTFSKLLTGAVRLKVQYLLHVITTVTCNNRDLLKSDLLICNGRGGA